MMRMTVQLRGKVIAQATGQGFFGFVTAQVTRR
jgi:hypothetical protein